MNPLKSIKELTRVERTIWIGSLLSIFISSAIFPNPNWLSIATSLVGATALIFVSKGDPLGQLICVIFSVLYAIVSLSFHYYGEMITYLFMSTPSAIWSLITWLRNPYAEREVKVANMTPKKWGLLLLGTTAVTSVMYFVLAHLGTANLAVSTFSITTSFLASMLTVLRSPYYALFYAANDIVLIIMWIMASFVSIGYLPMVICFIVFLINDLYGFFNWRAIRKRQQGK